MKTKALISAVIVSGVMAVPHTVLHVMTLTRTEEATGTRDGTIMTPVTYRGAGI
jgi:hypothetical protein